MQNLSSYLSQIDDFIDTPFSIYSSDNETILARRKQIEGYVSGLKIKQQAVREKMERKGWGLIPGFFSSTSQYQTTLESIASRLHQLLYQMNLLAPIMKLPTEVLHYIIRLRAHHFLQPIRLSQPIVPLNLLRWVAITQVCRLWRTLALKDPGLWTQISAAEHKWAIELLSRSRECPLSFQADFLELSTAGHCAASTVLQELSRIRDLSLALPEPNTMEKELTQPAPILEACSFRVFRLLRPQSLPEPLFQNIAPKLRQLSLESCHITWSSPLLHNITELRLARLHLDMTMSQFLDIFRNTPLIQVLHLVENEIYGARSGGHGTGISLVLLSSLTTFRFSGHAHICNSLLAHVDMPKHPVLFISVSFRQPEVLTDFVGPLSKHLDDPGHPFEHLSVKSLSRTMWTISGRKGGLSKAHPDAESCRHLFLRVSLTPALLASNNNDLPVALLSCLSIRGHLRSLSVDAIDIDLLSPNWGDTLDNVTSLTLQGDAVYKWLYSICVVTRGGVLPNLQKLALWGVEFLREPSTFHSLVKFIDSRQKQSRIQQLVLQDCTGLTDNELTHFQNSVPEVIISDRTDHELVD